MRMALTKYDPAFTTQLAPLLAGGAWVDLGRAAHKAKGTLSYLCAHTAKARAYAIEKAAKALAAAPDGTDAPKMREATADALRLLELETQRVGRRPRAARDDSRGLTRWPRRGSALPISDAFSLCSRSWKFSLAVLVICDEHAAQFEYEGLIRPRGGGVGGGGAAAAAAVAGCTWPAGRPRRGAPALALIGRAGGGSQCGMGDEEPRRDKLKIAMFIAHAPPGQSSASRSRRHAGGVPCPRS